MKLHMPVKGTYQDIANTSDDVFAQGLVGQGFVVTPSEGIVYAPFDGVITVMFPTGHAVAITNEDGVSVLVHIGLESVAMNGEGFAVQVAQGDMVRQGQPLIRFDLDKLAALADSSQTPVVILDSVNVSILTKETIDERDLLELKVTL
jgi:glucose-specific phosphotransferase system IIA component